MTSVEIVAQSGTAGGGDSSDPLPRPGSVLTAPGRELTFLRSSPGRLRFREDIGHDAVPVPPHRHLWQTERFTVLHGKLRLTIAGQSVELAEGESLEVPPRILHTYSPSPPDAGNGAVLIEVELRPALRGNRFFETIFALTREGGLPPRGFRDLVVLMALSYAHGFVIGGLPAVLMQATAAAGAALAGLLRIDHWSPRFAARAPVTDLSTAMYLSSRTETAS